MTVDDLLEFLTEFKAAYGGDVEVRADREDREDEGLLLQYVLSFDAWGSTDEEERFKPFRELLL